MQKKSGLAVICDMNPESFLSNFRGSYQLLAQSSFFIYALHEVDILPEIKRFCSKIFPQDQLWALTLDYLFVPVITAAICVLIYWLIKKFVPALLVPLTGGR